MQGRSASIVTRATPTCALTQIGASQRVSTIEFEDASRDKLPCLRYVLHVSNEFVVEKDMR